MFTDSEGAGPSSTDSKDGQALDATAVLCLARVLPGREAIAHELLARFAEKGDEAVGVIGDVCYVVRGRNQDVVWVERYRSLRDLASIPESSWPHDFMSQLAPLISGGTVHRQQLQPILRSWSDRRR